MSVGSQVAAFAREVAKHNTVWAIRFEDDSLLMWEDSNGTVTIPLWSSEKRATHSLKLVGEDGVVGAIVISFSLDDLISRWLPQFQQKNAALGPNWSGAELSGWSLSPDDVMRRISIAKDSHLT